MVTITSDVEGMMDVVVTEMDPPLVSIGHFVASTDLTMLTLRKGAHLFTYLFNGMQQLPHCDSGVISRVGASSPTLLPKHLYEGQQRLRWDE